MKQIAILGCFLLIQTSVFSEARADKLFVWNIGQGLWTTVSKTNSCLHFDMGGEFTPKLEYLASECAQKTNYIYFSHWDWDHIRFSMVAPRLFQRLCIAKFPGGPHPNKASPVDLLKACKEDLPDKNVSELTQTHGVFQDTNSESRVYILKTSRSDIVFPGDSPAKEEKIWDRRVKLAGVKILVLGHHGSRTATSRDLLHHLPNLRMAVASARKSRYGHPHREVIDRLKSAGIALLRTEEWGTIIFEL
jgi:competence protein ComEC